MTNPISEECAAIAARERRDEVLDALACALMDADRIHQPGACICRHGDGFSVVLEPYVEHDTVIDVDGNPVGVSKGARLALLHALGGVPEPEPEPAPQPAPAPATWRPGPEDYARMAGEPAPAPEEPRRDWHLTVTGATRAEVLALVEAMRAMGLHGSIRREGAAA